MGIDARAVGRREALLDEVEDRGSPARLGTP
jgi:hypothetical protein